MSDKVDKASVNYRHSRFGKKRCGNCIMYRHTDIPGNGTCTLVRGSISPVAVCDRWESK